MLLKSINFSVYRLIFLRYLCIYHSPKGFSVPMPVTSSIWNIDFPDSLISFQNVSKCSFQIVLEYDIYKEVFTFYTPQLSLDSIV